MHVQSADEFEAHLAEQGISPAENWTTCKHCGTEIHDLGDGTSTLYERRTDRAHACARLLQAERSRQALAHTRQGSPGKRSPRRRGHSY